MKAIKQFMKKAGTVIVAVSVAFSSFGGSAAASETQNVITVKPYKDQWKYFGQTKTFIQNEHYSLSEEVDISGAEWTLEIDGEKTGWHSFVLKGETEDEDWKFSLAADAPKFEIKPFRTDARVQFYSSDDGEKKELTEYCTSRDSIRLLAPEGFLISGKSEADESGWATELETGELKEGTNLITYYLRSDRSDITKKAIDQMPRKVSVKVDSIPPVVKSLSGNDGTDVEADGSISIEGQDSATYYYIVLPANHTQDVTREFIKENVASDYGIVGFGRVDSSREAALNFKGLTAKTEYKIFAFLEDDAGNVSEVAESNPFSTEKMALSGEVDLSGQVAVGSTLKAIPKMYSTNTGNLTYQWYRVKLNEDAAEWDAVYDETGGAQEDDLEADLGDEEDSGEDGEEDSVEEDTVDLASIRKKEMKPDEEVNLLDGASPIKGAVSDTYTITKEDIGYRLVVGIKAENYSNYVAGSTTTFVPKLMPQFVIPAVKSVVYSPNSKLSGIRLPAGWSWVDHTIVPVYGNSGYRAKFVPADRSIYKTVIVRVKVPVVKNVLRQSMVSVKKTAMYTGKAIKDNFSIKDRQKQLIRGKDFKAEYLHNKKLGKAIVTIQGIGNYKGKLRLTYQIVKRSMKNITCLYERTKVYRGKGKSVLPELELKNGTVELKKNRDYTVTYRNHMAIGKASMILEGKGNYKGKRTLSFSIVPRKPMIKRIVKRQQNIRLVLSSGEGVTGYRVYFSKLRSFTKEKTQEFVTSGTDFGIQEIGTGTWYIRVKAFTRKGGKEYTSSYSSVKKVIVK